MTEIEAKALALLNECAGAEVCGGWKTFDPNQTAATRALCRAIEQHEAFRQDVSDAVKPLLREWPEIRSHIVERLSAFIIAKPDPLVEAWAEAHQVDEGISKLETFRAALAKRGLEIVEKK